MSAAACACWRMGGGRREIGTVVSGAQHCITDLNGRVVYGPDVLRSSACPDLEFAWTAERAAKVVADYHSQLEEVGAGTQVELLETTPAVAA